MMTPRLYLHFVRHGAKKEDPDNNGRFLDECSEHGVEQVLATMNALFQGRNDWPAGVFHSDMERTRQCALAISKMFNNMIGTENISPQEDDRVGFMWALRAGIPSPNFEAIQAELRSRHGEDLQYIHWLQEPSAAAFIGAMSGSLRGFAVELWHLCEELQGDTHVVVVSHSPLCEALSPDPAIGMLGTADALTYLLEEDDAGQLFIGHPTRTNCPLGSGLD